MSQDSFDFCADVAKNEIDSINEYHHVYSSHHCEAKVIKLATLDWYLEFSAKNEENEYTVSLESLNESSLWKCDVEMEARFENGLESKIVKAEEQCSSFRNDISVKTTFDNVPKNVSVDVRIRVKNVKGIRRFPRFDLLKEVPELENVVLVFNEKKLKANRAFLAHFSPYFKNLFFGNIPERNQQEIQFNDIDFDEFVDLINVIIPGKKNITDDNVEHILKLAHRFDMQSVLDRCENFLMYNSLRRFLTVKNLILADKYLLIELHNNWIQSTTEKMLKKVLESEFYPELSDSSKVGLFEAACRLMKESEKMDEN